MRGHGDEAFHAFTFGRWTRQRKIDLLNGATGTTLDVIDDLMDALREFFEVGDSALHDAIGAAFAEAEHAGLAVDNLAEEAGGLMCADIDDGDEGRKGLGSHRGVRGTRRGSGIGEAPLVRFWIDIFST